ncbi:hypothetical protein JHK84_043642 [Glycine max]|nr:hypothetical protein JHK84_043642 [Glycine max]
MSRIESQSRVLRTLIKTLCLIPLSFTFLQVKQVDMLIGKARSMNGEMRTILDLNLVAQLTCTSSPKKLKKTENDDKEKCTCSLQSCRHLIRLLTERQLESLEASRNDFASLFGYQVEGHESEINMISEVDLVLRTGEVLELIQKDTFMGSIEALEVMRKQFSDVLLKNILEDRLMTA